MVDKDYFSAHTASPEEGLEYLNSLAFWKFSYRLCNVKYIGKTYRSSGIYFKNVSFFKKNSLINVTFEIITWLIYVLVISRFRVQHN